MADILIDNESYPATPAAGKSLIFVDATAARLVQLSSAAYYNGILARNQSTAGQSPSAGSENYITNSNLLLPSFGMQAGQLFRWYLSVSKTAAGVAAASFTFRVGTLLTTGDTSIVASAQTVVPTATASTGIIIVTLAVRSIGASGVCVAGWVPPGAAWGDGGSAVSAGFANNALAGQSVGITCTPGASAAWTINSVAGELIG